MKLRADRSQFADAVTWATRSVGARVSLPALSGVLFEAEGDQLTCRATDLETAAEVSVTVQVDEPGRALLPARLLAQLVTKLPDGPVELAGDADRVQIRCGRALFHVRGMAVDDFPTLPAPAAEAARGQVRADAFGRLVSQVARAASTDEARPVLTGVKLDGRDGRLRAAATDSYRLSVRDIPWPEDVRSEALVPARALQEAAKAATDDAVTIVFEEGQVSFLLGDRRLTTRLIEGTFPTVEQLIPESSDTTAVVDRATLVEALQRVSVVALGQANTPISLTFAEGSVDLHAGSQEVGDATESVPAELDGPGLTIAFNPTFLLSGLEATGSERVTVEMRDPLKPAVLRPAPDDGDEDGLTYLIMPMRVG